MSASQVDKTSSGINTVTSVISWIPGIPFYIGNLANTSSSTVGLVSWFVGLDLLFVGLGLWVRHKFARFTALMIFAFATCLQFIQFLYSGAKGSPASITEFCINGILFYFVFSRFDSQPVSKKIINVTSSS
jgi:hypothetical protein